VGWRLGSGRLGVAFWIAATVAITLFTSQVLTWIPAIREPGTPRYLYPGAFAVILVLFEAFRAFPFSRTAFVSIWLIALAGFCTNAVFLKDTGPGVREHSRLVALDVGVAGLVESAEPFEPGPGARSLAAVAAEPTIPPVPEAQRAYGGIGLRAADIPAQDAFLRERADSQLIQVYGIAPVPTERPPEARCETVRGGGVPGVTVIPALPAGGVVLESKVPAAVTVKRFGDEFSINVGTLNPNQASMLNIPADDGDMPWAVSATAPSLRACDLE